MTKQIIDNKFFSTIEKKYNLIKEEIEKGISLNPQIKYTIPEYLGQEMMRDEQIYDINKKIKQIKNKIKTYKEKNNTKTKFKKMFDTINNYNQLTELIEEYNTINKNNTPSSEVYGIMLTMQYKDILKIYGENKINKLYEEFKEKIKYIIQDVRIKRKNRDNCPICLDIVKKGITLECNHLIHRNCLEELIKADEEINKKIHFCPLCREIIL